MAAVPSSALWARLGRRWSRPDLLFAALVIQAVGIALPALIHGVAASLVSAVLFGATFIGVSTLALATGAHLQFPRSVALLTAGYSVGQILGPLVVAPLLHHGYRQALILAAVVVLASARPPPCCASASRTTRWWCDKPRRYDGPLRRTTPRTSTTDASDGESEMTTPRDLMIVTIDATPSSPAEQGDLSLALKIEKANPRRLRLGSADRSDPRLAPRTRPP